jgi:hypothetical protein
MRVVLAAFIALLMATPAFAASKITCSQIPAAQRFVSGLRPGPNTRAAQRYLDEAKHAKSDRQCVLDLGRVNYYAKRSAEADRRLAHRKATHAAAKPAPRGKCADLLHQDRPGGSDYRGSRSGCARTF